MSSDQKWRDRDAESMGFRSNEELQDWQRQALRADSAVPSSHVSETDQPKAGCGYPYCGGNSPECRHCANPKAEGESILREALARCVELFDKALPKFNWGASCLDAEAIRLLNEVPPAARSALEKTKP